MMSRMILNVQQKNFSETKAHLEPSQISMIELFVDKIANKDFCKKKKKSIQGILHVDVWQPTLALLSKTLL